MKKLIVCFLTTVLAAGLLAGCAGQAASSAAASQTASSQQPQSKSEATSSVESQSTAAFGGNFTDEMKIPYGVDISPEDGADSVERQGDHPGSPYFSQIDPYNLTSTDTLTILPKFKTIQQTSEWSCGVAAALMVLDYYGKLGDYNEQTLAELRPQGDKPGATSLSEAVQIFNKVGGFELVTPVDFGENLQDEFTLATIQDFLKDGVAVMVCWNDWGGHWQVIIGYDTMGTETLQDDVLIVADPYDTTDHNQDGYGVYGAERFYYNFTTYDFFPELEGNDMLFIAAKPIA